jgi:integrase
MASIDRVATGWRARWRTPDGQSRSKTFIRKADAERHLTATEHSKLSGAYVDPQAGRVTLRDYSETWRMAQLWRPLTEVRVETTLRNHIYPAFGDRPLVSLRPTEVQAWVRTLSEKMSPGYVKVTFGTLASIYRGAVRDHVIVSSPCEGARLPRQDRHPVTPLSVDAVERLADAIGDRYRPLVLVAAGAGLRLGESLGLGIDQVDFLGRAGR